MERAIIDKTIIDSLIRAKVATLGECARVEPLPVAYRHTGNGCNWFIPGWVGDANLVTRCADRISSYLSFLQAQFDIPREG